MDEDKVVFHIPGENGEDIECEVLFTYEDTGRGKTYIGYTDNTVDENGYLNVFAGYIDPNQTENFALFPIETDEEWELIDGIVKSLQPDGDEEADSLE
jgi:uncharacterized protein YrzB (UPF0473 family)